MNCKNVQASLSAYLDRELPAQDMMSIRAHLADCEPCREEAASLNCLKQLLRSVPAVEPSEGLECRLTANVFGHRDSSRIPAKVSYLFVTGVAAAAMIVTLAVLTAMGQRGAPQVVSDTKNELPVALSHDRMYDAGTDPLNGTPVVMPMNYASR